MFDSDKSWGRFMRDLCQFDAESIEEQVFILRQKLSHFELQLPPNLKFTDRNLYLQPSNGQRITFIMLKSWWHECHYDLYRFSLPGFRESINVDSVNTSFLKHCRQQVIQSAILQSKFWQSIRTMKHIFVSDPMVVVLVHSNTKVLLASQNIDAIAEMSNIPELLESNVSFLDDLAKRFPRVAVIVSSIPLAVIFLPRQVTHNASISVATRDPASDPKKGPPMLRGSKPK